MSNLKLVVTAVSFPMAIYMGYLWGQGHFGPLTIVALACLYVSYLINAYDAGRK